MLRVRSLLSVSVLTAVLSSTGAAARPVPTMHIKDAGFEPSVLVVPPGSSVVFRNESQGPSKPSGEGIPRPLRTLQPGQSLTAHYRRPGQFPIRDGVRPTRRATIVVAAGAGAGGGGSGGGAGGGLPKPPAGRAKHVYRMSLTLSVDERYQFFSRQWGTFDGPCNGEVGGGSRRIKWRATFPKVTYSRIVGELELLASDDVPVKIELFREDVKAKAIGRTSPQATCPDGSDGHAPTEDVSCTTNLSGRTARVHIGWGADATRNRLQFGLDGLDDGGNPCGPSFMTALALTGVDATALPLFLTRSKAMYDEGSIGPLDGREVGRIRTGAGVRIRRAFDGLSFSSPCCGWAGRAAAAPASAESYTVKASLELVLQPV